MVCRVGAHAKSVATRSAAKEVGIAIEREQVDPPPTLLEVAEPLSVEAADPSSSASVSSSRLHVAELQREIATLEEMRAALDAVAETIEEMGVETGAPAAA